jgi:hypothetical protein
VIERTPAWLNRYRRLMVRSERRTDIQEAFLHLGCSLIYLKLGFCIAFLFTQLPGREILRTTPRDGVLGDWIACGRGMGVVGPI